MVHYNDDKDEDVVIDNETTMVMVAAFQWTKKTITCTFPLGRYLSPCFSYCFLFFILFYDSYQGHFFLLFLPGQRVDCAWVAGPRAQHMVHLLFWRSV